MEFLDSEGVDFTRRVPKSWNENGRFGTVWDSLEKFIPVGFDAILGLGECFGKIGKNLVYISCSLRAA